MACQACNNWSNTSGRDFGRQKFDTAQILDTAGFTPAKVRNVIDMPKRILVRPENRNVNDDRERRESFDIHYLIVANSPAKPINKRGIAFSSVRPPIGHRAGFGQAPCQPNSQGGMWGEWIKIPIGVQQVIPISDLPSCIDCVDFATEFCASQCAERART